MSQFTDLVTTGTTKRRQVDIYTDPALIEELHQMNARMQRAQAEEDALRKSGDWAMSDKSALPELEAEAAELWSRYEQTKQVWHVRGLTGPERDKIKAEYPIKDAPLMPSRNAPRAVLKAWEDARDEWKPEALKAERRQRMALIALATEKVVIADKVVESIALEDVEYLYSLPGGEDQYLRLFIKVEEASQQGESPVPFSQRGSESTQD